MIPYAGTSQNDDSLTIRSFCFSGLVKTKEWYLLREIRYREGDKISFSRLDEVMELLRSDLRKTNLLTHIEVTPLLDFNGKNEVEFQIYLQENWFVFPSLITEIADRNFNVWWNEYNHSLNRINLGLAIQHTNLTGCKDELTLSYHFGYTKRAVAKYYRPAFNTTSKLGFGGAMYYTEYKETPITTLNNKQIFIKDGDKILYRRREISCGINYKKSTFWTFDLQLNHHRNSLNKELAEKYPDFFLQSSTKQVYTQLSISALYFDLDHILKPTRGLLAKWTITQTGIPYVEQYSYNSLFQTVKMCHSFGKRIFLETALSAKCGIDRKKRPYNLYKGLGYTDTNISGYEYYVIDGLDYFYLNNQIRYFFYTFNWNLFRLLPGEPVFRIKTDVDIALQCSQAYVHDPFYNKGNEFVNRLLYSSGAGLNFTWNDLVEFNIFYSINHAGQGGLYFHTRKSF